MLTHGRPDQHIQTHTHTGVTPTGVLREGGGGESRGAGGGGGPVYHHLWRRHPRQQDGHGTVRQWHICVWQSCAVCAAAVLLTAMTHTPLDAQTTTHAHLAYHPEGKQQQPLWERDCEYPPGVPVGEQIWRGNLESAGKGGHGGVVL